MRPSLNPCHFLFLCTSFLWNQLSAQVCGKYDYLEAFILDIRHEGDSKQARDVEVWLKELRSNQAVKRILPNEQIRINGHLEYPRAGKFYLVDFRSTSWKNPEPIYVASVVYRGYTLNYRLPYGNRVHTCGQHLYEKRRNWNDTLRAMNGRPHVPFRIIPGQPEAGNTIQYPLTTVFAHPEWLVKSDEEGLHAECRFLQKINITDALSLNTIQVIDARPGFCVRRNETQHFRQMDVYGDNPNSIPDFCFTRLEIERTRPLPNDVYRDFWLYSQRHQIWYRSNLLSEYANVEPDAQGWPQRTEYEDSAGVIIIKRYQCDGKKWMLVSVQRNAPPKPPERAKPRYDYCLSVNGNAFKNKPVQLGTSSEPANFFVRDTFELYNPCDRTIELECTDAHAWMLHMPTAIGPGSSANITYEVRHALDPEAVQMQEGGFTIRTSAGQLLNLGIRYYLAGSKTVLRDSLGRPEAFRAINSTKFSTRAVLVNAQGLPLAEGEWLRGTKRKTGFWRYFDSTGRSTGTELHGKTLSISIQNQSRLDSAVRVETHRNGGWEPAFYEYSGNVFLIATDAETDSIRIQSSAYSATCRYRYRLEQDKVHFAGYLSLPGEAAYHNGICRVPLNTPGFLYVLSWNWNVPEMNNARMLQQQATLLAALRRQFPGLRTDICIQDELKQVLNLDALNEGARQRLLQKLSTMPEIETISRMVQPTERESTFAAREVGIIFDVDVVPEKFRAQLEAAGFLRMQQTWGSTHYYQASWKEKTMDNAFYEALSALAAVPGIHHVQPQFYSRVHAEPADKVSE